MKKFRKWLLEQGLTENSLSKSDLIDLKAEYEIVASLPEKVEFSVEGKIECAISEDEAELPKFKIVAYTGQPIKQKFGEVIIDIQGMDISKQIPILWHHDTKLPIGHSTSIEKVEGTGVVIEGVVSGDQNDPVVAKFLTMSKNGFPFQASIGAPVRKARRISAGMTDTVNGVEIKAGMIVAQVTELVETSILPIGADRNTNTKISANGGENFNNVLGNKMKKFDLWLEANGFGDANALDVEIKASLEKMYNAEVKAEADAKSKGVESNKELLEIKAEMAEMKRVEGIKAEGGENSDIIATAIENKWSVEQTKASVTEIEKIRAERNAPAIHIKTEGATSVGSIEASMGVTMGLSQEDVKAGLSEADMNEGASLKDMGFMKASQMLLQASGKYSVGMSNEEMLRLAFSTTSLPTILNNVANKSLMAEYNGKASNIMEVAFRVNAKDFKDVTLNNIFKDLVLEKIGETGEMKQGTTSETSYTVSVDSYAKTFSVGRQTLINDDLDALRRVFAGYGRGASVAEQRNFWGTFLDDGGSFYSVGNNNLLTGANSVLSIDAVSLALQALWAQTDSNGDPIQLSSTKLVVPPSLSIFANQIAKDSIVNETTATGKAKPNTNPHANKFSVVTESYLDNGNVAGASSTAWYLVADQSDVQTYASARLASAQEPTIRQGPIGIGGLGQESDCVFDFGSALVDPIGVVKSTGV